MSEHRADRKEANKAKRRLRTSDRMTPCRTWHGILSGLPGENGHRKVKRKEAEETLAKGLPLTALVVVIDGEAVGALAGAINEHIFEIWSLYVEPGHRRKGAGRALVDALEKLLESVAGDKTSVAGMPIRARKSPGDQKDHRDRAEGSFLRCSPGSFRNEENKHRYTGAC